MTLNPTTATWARCSVSNRDKVMWLSWTGTPSKMPYLGPASKRTIFCFCVQTETMYKQTKLELWKNATLAKCHPMHLQPVTCMTKCGGGSLPRLYIMWGNGRCESSKVAFSEQRLRICPTYLLPTRPTQCGWVQIFWTPWKVSCNQQVCETWFFFFYLVHFFYDRLKKLGNSYVKGYYNFLPNYGRFYISIEILLLVTGGDVSYLRVYVCHGYDPSQIAV